MMYDIQAIQYLYGANFTTNSSNSTYTFNTTTGEMSINGVGQGASSANVVFRTVWDGNGIDTYNLSNYTTNLNISLVPGAYSNFGTQLALLHYDGTQVARGNLFNALQYNGDIRSLIENAIGGSGNDTLVGNIAGNMLDGGSGNDSLDGGSGNDVLIGGIGNDTILGGGGNDVLIGGVGIDSLVGGSGDDVYYINDNADDVIVEALNGGIDTVYDSVGIGSLGANIDNVVMYGTSNVMVGNSLANTFTATSHIGGVTIDGGAGNDVFYTSNYSDSLVGGAGNDIFISYYSVDGADSLYGGTGDDAYYLFEADTIYWENVGEGYDILFTQINVTLAANNSIDYIYNYGAATITNS
jgi:serralysin